MKADIAFANRAEDRIGQGMHRRVGIGVAFEREGMRDANAQQA